VRAGAAQGLSWSLAQRLLERHHVHVGEFTRLLEAVRSGQPGAVDQLVTLCYPELRQLAHQRLRRTGAITVLDTTSLVHECYLRLVKVGELDSGSRAHFLGYAGKVMRSVVVDLARERLAKRRGGNDQRITLGTDIPDRLTTSEQQLVRVDEALRELARLMNGSFRSLK